MSAWMGLITFISIYIEMMPAREVVHGHQGNFQVACGGTRRPPWRVYNTPYYEQPFERHGEASKPLP